ncbi:MAG TPA: PilZ domain-containing protein [Planctomycetota bacterium]|jgi:hypothetical protein|nr:PilZ domain-containing protein [Planctomycetota bacterium]
MGYLYVFLGGVLVLAALYARRARFLWTRVRTKPNPLEEAIHNHHLDSSQASTLGALAACGSPADPPPFASAESFDRKAVLRLREVLRRGGDVRAEAERLRILRRNFAFADPLGPAPHILSAVYLVSPTGEKCEGIVLGVDEDYLVVATRGTSVSLRGGTRLSVLNDPEAKVEDAGAIVVGVEDMGDCRVVRIGFPREEGQSRRRHFRLVARLPAMARVGAEAPFEEAIVIDVSRTGLRLQLRPSETPKRDDPVVLQMKVGEEVVEANGKVAWALPALYLSGAGQPWIVGAEFPKFQLEDWTRIVERVLAAAGGKPAGAGVRTVSPEAIP